MSNSRKLICIAVITSAHGIRGAVKIRSFTSNPEDIENYSPLYNVDGSKEYNLKILSDTGDLFIAEIEGIKNRNEAEILRGAELYIYRDMLPEVDEDEFYYEDLIGLQARDIKGVSMGIVLAVYNYGAGDVVEVKLNDRKETELFAFTKEIVPEINISGGYIVIDRPEIEFVNDNNNNNKS